MKLRAILSDRKANVELRLEESRLFAAVDNRRYELDVHESSENQFLIMSEGNVFDCRVETCPASGQPLDVSVGTERYSIILVDPKRLRGSSNETAHGHEAAQIVAPMPGKVVRLLVEVGTEVQVGQGIIAVEAMKMQNEMKSPKAGTVVTLNVHEGATVNAGDILATIE
jgi:biotin carboxyl carrier protein